MIEYLAGYGLCTIIIFYFCYWLAKPWARKQKHGYDRQSMITAMAVFVVLESILLFSGEEGNGLVTYSIMRKVNTSYTHEFSGEAFPVTLIKVQAGNVTLQHTGTRETYQVSFSDFVRFYNEVPDVKHTF